MGFKYYRRIKLGKGLGLNISKSGITTSYRSKRGSIGSKGYSIRTGIPGLTYGKGFKKSKSGCMLFICFMILIITLFSCTTDDIDDTGSGDCSCSDFSTQSQAQSAFNSGSCGNELDRDNDGIACEDLPNG